MSIIAGVDNPISIPRKQEPEKPKAEAKTAEAKKATTTKKK